MHKLFYFIAHNRHFSAMVALIIIVYGLVAIDNATISRDPDYAIPVVSVNLLLPGASPGEIQRTVIFPIEDELRSLADLDRIDTKIESGRAHIRAEFRYGVDVSLKRQDMESAINGIRFKLPDALEYSLKAVRVSDFQTSFMITLGGTADPALVFAQARGLEARLQALPELKNVHLLRADEEISISVDLEKATRHGIPLSKIASEIENANTNLPARRVVVDGRYYSIRPPQAALAKPVDLNDILMQAGEGRSVRLADIATVRVMAEQQPVIVRVDGKPVTMLKATAEPDINIFKVNDRLTEALDQVRRQLPDGMILETVYNQSDEVWRLVESLVSSFALTAIVLFVIFYFTVEARSTLIIMMLLPLSFLASMSALSFTDYGVQQVSMAGFIIALGMIVDNGIVVTENAFLRERYRSMSRVDAAVQGASDAFSPLLSSTLTTMVAFAPIFFLTSPSGLYLRSLSATIWINLLCSLFVACTVIVLLLSMFGTLDKVRWLPAPRSLLTAIIPYRDTHFRAFLNWGVNHRAIIIGLFIAVFIGTGFVVKDVPVKLMPPSDDPYLTVNVAMPRNAGPEARAAALTEIENVLRNHEGILRVFAFSGISAPTVNVGMDSEGDPVFLLRTNSATERHLLNLADSLSKALEHFRVNGAISVSPFDPARAGPRKSDLSLIIAGPDHEALVNYAKSVRDIAGSNPDLTRISNPAELTDIAVRVELDDDAMAARGVSRSELAQALTMLSFGQEVGHLRDERGEETPIRLKIARADGSPFVPTDGLSIIRDNGERLALSDVARIHMGGSRAQIDHLNFRPTVEAEFWLRPGAKARAFGDALLEKMQTKPLPPGADMRIGGKLETLTKDYADLGKFAGFAAGIIFTIFVLQFRSLVQPLIVFSAIPFCAVGAALAIALSGQYLSFIAALGLASLMGIVVNDSILLVDEANVIRTEEPDKSIREVAVEAAVRRFMPVVLTSLTTTLGLLPVAVGDSPFRGMATVIAGGLASSTVLILLLVPVLYSLLTRR